jgi:hypothetical protein
VLTTSPMAVTDPAARMAPTSTSPVFTPTRICRSWPSAPASSRSVACMRRAARTARSGSSSWATVAPNSATMASPTILSTWPPKLVTSAANRSKHRSTMSFTRSGSSRSERPVNPTRSANSTVTMRRSSSWVRSGRPQDAQKRAPSPTSAPHAVQVTAAA